MIKANYYFIAPKKGRKCYARPSRTVTISSAKSDFVMQANKVAPANFSRTLQEEPTDSMQGGDHRTTKPPTAKEIRF